MTHPDDPGTPDVNRRPDVGQVEERLRIALAQEAREITPTDLLSDIRGRVEEEHRRPGRRPWLLPLATAAAVAAIALVAWLGIRPSGVTLPVPGNTSSTGPQATAAPTGATPSSTVMTTSVPPTSPATTSISPTVSRAIPVYIVEPVGTTGWGLVREFMTQPIPVGADAAALGQASVDQSLRGGAANATGTILQAWPAPTTSTVRLGSPQIDVVLSRRGVAGLTPDQQAKAVQQVVWAVTAGVGQNLPVSISVSGGGPIFETQPAGIYKRPASDQVGRDVAPIWIDSPATGSVLPATASVVVSGQACTFEANVLWRLERGGQQVKQGATTASIACPSLGSWKVDLGRLPVGDYTFHAVENSAADGSVRADQQVTFTVQ